MKEKKPRVTVDGAGATAKTVKKSFDLMTWLREHPLADIRFSFFIFVLIPVQTLFTYNWLILPQYLERAFAGGIVNSGVIDTYT